MQTLMSHELKEVGKTIYKTSRCHLSVSVCCDNSRRTSNVVRTSFCKRLPQYAEFLQMVGQCSCIFFCCCVRLKFLSPMSWMNSSYKTNSTPERISSGKSLPSPQSLLGVVARGGFIIRRVEPVTRNEQLRLKSTARFLVFYF